MKKILAVMLCMIFALGMLTACGGSAAKPEESAAPSAGMPNPFTETDADGMLQATGLQLVPPEGAEDVRYSYMDSGKEFKMAQLDFTWNGKSFCYRAEPTGEFEAYDMSGLYYDFTDVSEVGVGYNTGVLELCSEAGAVYWLDIVPGINYSLGCSAPVTAEELTELANLIYVPTQGEAYGDADFIEMGSFDWSGSYRDGDQDERSNMVVLSKEGSSYSVNISIYRLAQFEGTGNIEDDAIYATVTDPNGNEMVFVFFYNTDDCSFTLKAALSKWDLLETGFEFPGFFRVEG